MRNNLILKPTFTYLFSYVWLIGELLVFSSLLNLFFPTNFCYASLVFMIVFSRFYYWMNFSPESKVQSIFIIGMIPISFLMTQGNEWDMIPLIFYLGLFLLVGVLRISKLRYIVSEYEVSRVIFTKKTVVIDYKREITIAQTKAGKTLNFGCVLVPCLNENPIEKNWLSSMLYKQRKGELYEIFFRMDGVKSPSKTLEKIEAIYGK